MAACPLKPAVCGVFFLSCAGTFTVSVLKGWGGHWHFLQCLCLKASWINIKTSWQNSHCLVVYHVALSNHTDLTIFMVIYSNLSPVFHGILFYLSQNWFQIRSPLQREVYEKTSLFILNEPIGVSWEEEWGFQWTLTQLGLFSCVYLWDK